MRCLGIFMILCLFLPACDKIMLGDENLIDTDIYLKPPHAFEDGLEVSSPYEQHLDSTRLYNMIRRFQQDGSNGIRSILIARNNKLVLEAYFNGWHRERKQDLRSATKSFASAVMGIAIDKGIVKSVDEKVLDFFPEYDNYANWDDRKAEMTIKDFLRMRTGLSCNDWVDSSPGNEEKMYQTDDWIKFILDLPLSVQPGQTFSYCSGAPIVMSAIINRTSGKTNFKFADENLFAPLGITDYVWEYMPAKRENTGGQLHLRPRDLMKFGLLFLNDGKCKGNNIISADWVTESTNPTGDITGQLHPLQYGYYWWYNSWTINGKKINAYFANGNGGQLIYVLKELNMVVVFTGGSYNTDAEFKLYKLMENTILPAILE